MSERRARDLVARVVVFGSVAFAFVLGALPACAQNLLPDPQFEQGIGGFVPTFPTQMQWSPSAGADGSPGFVELRVAGPGASAIAGACLPIVAGRTYSWGATLNSRFSVSFVTLYFFADGACQGPGTLLIVPGPADFVQDIWQFEPGANATAPAGASSVQILVVANVARNGLGGVDIDNVYFGPQGPPGGLGVPALSRPLTILLVAALAIVGLRALKPA